MQRTAQSPWVTLISDESFLDIIKMPSMQFKTTSCRLTLFNQLFKTASHAMRYILLGDSNCHIKFGQLISMQMWQYTKT